MTDLKDLRERVEKAEWPDRELDGLVWISLDLGADIHWSGNDLLAVKEGRETLKVGWIDPGKYQRNFALWNLEKEVPYYTASIDAAVGLIERKLPGWGWFLRRDDTLHGEKRAAPVYNAALLYPDALRVTPGSAQRPTPALALIAALLSALENTNG
jgi:hypothetical protein